VEWHWRRVAPLQSEVALRDFVFGLESLLLSLGDLQTTKKQREQKQQRTAHPQQHHTLHSTTYRHAYSTVQPMGLWRQSLQETTLFLHPHVQRRLLFRTSERTCNVFWLSDAFSVQEGGRVNCQRPQMKKTPKTNFSPNFCSVQGRNYHPITPVGDKNAQHTCTEQGNTVKFQTDTKKAPLLHHIARHDASRGKRDDNHHTQRRTQAETYLCTYDDNTKVSLTVIARSVQDRSSTLYSLVMSLILKNFLRS
jgi:hypothetical protein